MLNKFVIIVLMFLFSAGTIPDSLGCVQCWGKPGQGFNLLDLANDRDTPKSARGGLKTDRPVQADPNGSAPCHFCLMEMADNPGGYALPGLMMFSEIRPVPMAKKVGLVYSINHPPEFLL